jgi:hypothetical protein
MVTTFPGLFEPGTRFGSVVILPGPSHSACITSMCWKNFESATSALRSCTCSTA